MCCSTTLEINQNYFNAQITHNTKEFQRNKCQRQEKTKISFLVRLTVKNKKIKVQAVNIKWLCYFCTKIDHFKDFLSALVV